MPSLNIKTLTQGLVICLVAVVGVVIIGLGGATHSPTIDLKVDSVKVYPANPVSQLERTTVTISIANSGQSVLQLAPGLQMQLIDNTGQSHPMTASYLPAGFIVGGPLQPGNSWTQQIDFNLSPAETPATFIYQPDGQPSPIEVNL